MEKNKVIKLLEECIKEDGTFPDEYKGIRLKIWAKNQRNIYNNGIHLGNGDIVVFKKGQVSHRLTKLQIKKLNDLNFNWGYQTHTWDEKFMLLKECIREDGTFPNEYKGVNLRSWINNQRSTYNNGKHLENGNIIYNTNILTKLRIEKLDSIGFIWKERLTWDESYALLKECIKEDGSFPDEYKGFNLKDWAINQRIMYNRGKIQENGDIIYKTKKGNRFLLKDQIDRLNEINFVWKERLTWNENYTLLKECIRNDGSVPKVYKDVNISRWLTTQKKVYSIYINDNGEYNESIEKLTTKSKSQLEKLKRLGIFEVDRKWNYKFNVLLDYLKENNGEFPLSTEIYKDVKIGVWINHLRKIYQNGIRQENGTLIHQSYKLTKEQIEKLDSINFTWYVNDSLFKNKTVKDKEQMQCVRRFLLYKMRDYLNGTEISEDLNKELILKL